MRHIIVLSMTIMVGCGSAPFTAGDPTTSDPTGAEMSPGMTPSPSSSASTADPPSLPDSGTMATTAEAGVGESATTEANSPTGNDNGATTHDSGSPSPDSGGEVDAGGQAVDSGMVADTGAVTCTNAYCVGLQCPGCLAFGNRACTTTCSNGTQLNFCTSDCLSR